MTKDFSKLIGLIYEKYGSRKAFCEEFGKPPEWLSRRLNNQVQFDADDMIAIMDLLGIDPQNINTYFFTPNVL